MTSTFWAMLFRPLGIAALTALLLAVVRAVRRHIPEGRLKRVLLLHLWDTDPERQAREAIEGPRKNNPSARQQAWAARGRNAGHWIRSRFG